MENSCLGIDVSKEKLDWCLKVNGQVFTHRSKNSEASIIKSFKWIKEKGLDLNPLIVVESTGSYHWLVCLLLVDKGLDVRLINPLITKKYQKSSIRNAKSDTVDAARLADIAQLEPEAHLPKFFDTRETLTTKRYQTLLHKLQTTVQQLNRSLQSAQESASIIDVSMDLSCIKNAVESLYSAITALKKIIESSHDDLAQKLAEIPGVSLFQASVFSTAVRGRTFHNRDQLTAFFGIDVRARQSGNWKGSSHLSKRGNPFYRKVLFQLGWSLWRNNHTYREYYEKLKASGKHYFTILIAIARKFLRFFFSNYLTTPYN